MGQEIVLKTFIDRSEAQMAKGLLDAQGILNMLSDEDIGGFQPGMIMGEPIKLIVNQEDLTKATAAIRILGES